MNERGKSGIYAIVNTANQKCYIGQAASIGDRWLYHRSSLRRGKHHSRLLQNAWNKYGEAAFQFKVVEYAPRDAVALAEREQMWLDVIKPAYNIAPVSASTLGIKHPPRSDDFKRRMAEMKRGYKPSPEQIEKQRRHAMENPYRHTPEAKAKISAGLAGKKPSPEAVEKTRRANTGRKQTPEEIAKRIAANTGRKRSPEQCARISESLKGKRLGTKMSEETKAKIGAAHKGRKRPDVTAASKGVPRSPEVVEAIRAGHLKRWADRAADIKSAILAAPDMSITKIARALGADRETVSKYRKELKCQPPQPSASERAVNVSQPVQGDLFT